MKEFRSVEALTVFSFSIEKSVMVLAFESGNLQLVQLKITDNDLEFNVIRMVEAHTSPVTGIVIEDSFVYSCAGDGRLIITSISDANKFVDITLDFLPKAVDMTEDMNYLYFCDGRNVVVFDVNQFKNVREFSTEVGDDVTAFCVSDKGFVVVAGDNGMVALFSAQFELIRKFQMVCKVSGFSFNERFGLFAVSDENGIVHLCNCSGDVLFRWKTHDVASAVCFTGSSCVSAGYDLNVRVWKLEGLGL
jgi:WD40 repeat protein